MHLVPGILVNATYREGLLTGDLVVLDTASGGKGLRLRTRLHDRGYQHCIFSLEVIIRKQQWSIM